MPIAPERISKLNRGERKVLADLQLLQNQLHETRLSVRQLADLTGLSTTYVVMIINRLNELQLVSTLTGTWLKPTVHRVLYQVPLRPKPVQSVREARL